MKRVTLKVVVICEDGEEDFTMQNIRDVIQDDLGYEVPDEVTQQSVEDAPDEDSVED